MSEYHKIETLFERDMEGSKKLIEGKFRNECIEYLKDNKWIFTEKVDGTKRELDILVKNSPENDRPIIEEFIPEILAICEKFGNSGQSGGSAPYTAQALSQAIKKLCLQQPICPITGIEEEWNNIGSKEDDYQNNRCSNIFKKGKDGRAYFLDAIVWKGEDDYDTFTGILNGITSRQYIKSFPFEPKTFYINVVRDFNVEGLEDKDIIETGLGKYIYRIKDEKQLDEVFTYYDKFI